MSQVIDNRVVSMEFDNSKFEKNVQTSMETLQNLNKTLDNLPETAGKNMFDGISQAARNIDLSGISDGIESINRKFSALGIAGQEVIRDLTRSAINFGKSTWNKTFGQIKSGGIARATNIEQAKFMLEGMGVAFEQVEDSINGAVTDTAYGFDEAARAAATLAASGVKLGDDMSHSLLAISGVAAMTNRSYSEIADIFSDAASVRVSADTFNRLGERGLAVKQIMADTLNTSTENLDKMVRKGQVSFQQFSDAMYESFGAHAKESNETFQGVTANIRAALSRIGQTFYQPLLANKSSIVYMLQSVKGQLNEIKKITDPFAERLAKEVLHLADLAKGFIDSIDVSVIKPIFEGLIKLIDDFNKSETTLIETGSAIISIFKSISKVGKEAFKEIFPSNMDKPIQTLAKKLQNFVGGLVPAESTLAKFKRVFKGFFAIISIGIKVFKDLSAKLSPVTDKLKELASAALDIAANIGDFFVELNDKYDITKPFENLAESFDHLKEKIGATNIGEHFERLVWWVQYIGEIFKVSFGEAGGGIAGIINGSFEVIIAAIEILTDRFRDLTGIDLGDFVYKITDGLYNIKESLIEFVSTFSVVDKIKMILNGIKNAFSSIVEALKPVGQAVKKFLKPFWDAIKDIGKAISEGFKNPGMFLNLASMMVIFEHLRRRILFFIQDIGHIKKGFEEGFNLLAGLKKLNFVNVLDTARVSLNQFSNELKANTILKTAAAIAILAVALMLLASIDENKLLGACVAMGELFIAIGVMFQMLSGVGGAGIKDTLKLSSLGTAMIKIAAAVLILAGAMKMMDGLEHVVDDTLVIIIMMLALIGVAEAIQVLNIQSFNKVATSMILMAFAVKILAKAMTYFDGLSWENVIQGLVSIITMMAALVAVGWAVQKFIGEGSFMKTAAGMILMAGAVKMLASAVKTLGNMDPDALTQGLLALFGVMAMLGLLVMGISLTLGDGFIKTAVGITMLAVSVGILAHALKTIAEIDPDRLPAALWALFYVMGALVLICVLLKDSLLQAGAGLLLVAVAMAVLVGAVAMLGSMDLGTMIQGILGLAACLVILAVALAFIQGSIAGAAALLIVSVALIPFALALAILTALPLGDLAGTLLVLCVALAALTVVCYALTGAIVGAAALLVLSAALIVFGVACAILTALPLGDLAGTLLLLLAAIVAFSVVGSILSLLAPFMIVFSAALTVLGIALASIGASIMIFAMAVEILSVSGVTAATALSMFCSILGENLATLTKAASVLTIIAAALVVLDAAMIVAAISMTACAVALGLLSAAMLIFSAAAVVFAASLRLVTGSLKSCITEIKQLLDENKFRDVAKSAITGIVKGFKDGVSKAVEAAKELGESILNKIKEFPAKLKEAGANAITGFINGLKSKLGDAKQAAATLGKSVLNKLKSSLKIKSPSRETAKVGMYFDEGLAKGIEDNTKLATNAASDMADDTVDAMSGALDVVSGALDADMNPVITPEMDLTEIQNGMNSMNSMMDQKRVANISANYNARQTYDQEQMQFSQAQMSNLGTQLASLASMMAQPTPIDVHTDVNLVGGIDKFFQATVDMNNRYKKMHGGRNAYA